MTDGPFATDAALCAFLAIVAQILRETSISGHPAETDLLAVYDRFRYLVQTACDPRQPYPLSHSDVESLKRLKLVVDRHLEGEQPLIPYP